MTTSVAYDHHQRALGEAMLSRADGGGDRVFDGCDDFIDALMVTAEGLDAARILLGREADYLQGAIAEEPRGDELYALIKHAGVIAQVRERHEGEVRAFAVIVDALRSGRLLGPPLLGAPRMNQPCEPWAGPS